MPDAAVVKILHAGDWCRIERLTALPGVGGGPRGRDHVYAPAGTLCRVLPLDGPYGLIVPIEVLLGGRLVTTALVDDWLVPTVPQKTEELAWLLARLDG